MKIWASVLLATLLSVVTSASALAHHSIAGEYGGADYPYNYMEGEVVQVKWINPHISFAVRATSGYFSPDTIVWANSHPREIILTEGGMDENTVAVCDKVKIYGWEHLRGMPQFHIRAMAVNDSPMQSVLAFADMWDILRGNTNNHIEWAISLEGKSPGRMGPEMIEGLTAMGLIDERGRFSWNGQDPL